jgi:drug/metabolite transporter (DMT)-like permease
MLTTKVLMILAVLVGVAAVIAGGADDSPGLQALGVALAVGGVVLGARRLRGARDAGRRTTPPTAS